MNTQMGKMRLWFALIGPVAGFLLTGCAMSIVGLEPEHPPSRWRFYEVDTLQPTLRWETFPRPEDYAAHGEEFRTRVSNVTYDLRLWESMGGNRYGEKKIRTFGEYTDSDYSRDGLVSPFHTVEIPLRPATAYYWTVRARFAIDGHPRVTEWGRQLDVIFPEEYGYWFKTPRGSNHHTED